MSSICNLITLYNNKSCSFNDSKPHNVNVSVLEGISTLALQKCANYNVVDSSSITIIFIPFVIKLHLDD